MGAKHVNDYVYFVSLYFRTDVHSGANKRFDELGRELADRLGRKLRIIVCRGHKPHWADIGMVDEVPLYANRVQRIRTLRRLNQYLASAAPGIVMSDFMPIPFRGLQQHRHYQVIYDLRNFTEFRRGGLSVLSGAFQRSQLRRSRRIITISEYSRSELELHCQIPKERVLVSYCGVSDEYATDDALQADRTVDLLYVANFEPRKNHGALLDAIEKMRSPLTVKLVGGDFGTRGLVAERLQSSAALQTHAIELVESVSEAELRNLYRSTRLYVFPSLLEGFGMPLIEAMISGCRVICSDIPVFREICHDHAQYFEPRDPASIASAIEAGLAAPVPATQITFAKRYLWGEIADQLIDDLELTTSVA